MNTARSVAGAAMFVVAAFGLAGCAEPGSVSIPEFDREQTAEDVMPSDIQLYSDSRITPEDTRLAGIDSGGNSWYIARHGQDAEVCIAVSMSVTAEWFASCGIAQGSFTLAFGDVTGTFDTTGSTSEGERVGSSIFVTGA